MIRVLVADDHTMFRDMLKIAIPREGDLQVVGEAADGHDVCAAVERLRPDVVLLDYRMPRVKDFAALVRELRRACPATQVIVLSGFATQEIAQRAAEGGASGYVLKSTRLAAIVDAVRTVAAGGVWIDPGLPRRIFETFQRSREAGGPASPLAALTRRERQVLGYVALGISNRGIAEKLCLSEQTVKTHLTNIFDKLEVRNRWAAALAFYGRDVPRSDADAR
ncbi:MAG: response regulator transcription factor [Thermodesulfobacteriota bacterium]